MVTNAIVNPMILNFDNRSLKIMIPVIVAKARIPTFCIGKKLLPSNPKSKILNIRYMVKKFGIPNAIPPIISLVPMTIFVLRIFLSTKKAVPKIPANKNRCATKFTSAFSTMCLTSKKYRVPSIQHEPRKTRIPNISYLLLNNFPDLLLGSRPLRQYTAANAIKTPITFCQLRISPKKAKPKIAGAINDIF